MQQRRDPTRRRRGRVCLGDLAPLLSPPCRASTSTTPNSMQPTSASADLIRRAVAPLLDLMHGPKLGAKHSSALETWMAPLGTLVVTIAAVVLSLIQARMADREGRKLLDFLDLRIAPVHRRAAVDDLLLPTPRCPYCAERVRFEATVCPHCQRDMFPDDEEEQIESPENRIAPRDLDGHRCPGAHDQNDRSNPVMASNSSHAARRRIVWPRRTLPRGRASTMSPRLFARSCRLSSPLDALTSREDHLVGWGEATAPATLLGPA